MAMFKKKPAVIEAVQFFSKSLSVLIDKFPEARKWYAYLKKDKSGWALEIPTLEGTMTASEGDWIIKGIAGEFYPCKPDIFVLTYNKLTPEEKETTMQINDDGKEKEAQTLGVYTEDGFVALEDMGNGIKKCARCSCDITPENDSHWEVFVDGHTTQAICIECNENDNFDRAKEFSVAELVEEALLMNKELRKQLEFASGDKGGPGDLECLKTNMETHASLLQEIVDKLSEEKANGQKEK